MNFKSISKAITIGVIGLIVLLILFSVVFNLLSQGGKDCQVDDDCVPFGASSSNAGCYHKEKLPLIQGGHCLCAAPPACACINHICSGVYPEQPNLSNLT